MYSEQVLLIATDRQLRTAVEETATKYGLAPISIPHLGDAAAILSSGKMPAVVVIEQEEDRNALRGLVDTLVQLQPDAPAFVLLGLREGSDLDPYDLFRIGIDGVIHLPPDPRRIDIQLGRLIRYAGRVRRVGEKLEIQRRFLSMAIHDMKTPINSIIGFTELLRGSTTDPVMSGDIERILKNGRVVEQLLHQLLDIATLESGSFRLRPAAVSLARVVRDSMEILAYAAKKRRVRVDVRAAEPVPAITGDHQRLVEVVSNLLDNAIKHSPRGSLIELSLDAVEGGVRISVADDGPGIPPEYHDRIFDRFQRIPGSLEGHGLGLDIAREIVSLHGGRIWVEAGRPRGSVFHVFLPGDRESLVEAFACPGLEVRATSGLERLVLALQGSLLEDNAGAFERWVTPILHAWPGDIVLDLSRCRTISSRGIGLLLAIKAEASRKMRRCLLRDPDPRILDFFGLCRLHDVFQIETSPQGAKG